MQLLKFIADYVIKQFVIIIMMIKVTYINEFMVNKYYKTLIKNKYTIKRMRLE